MSRALIGWSGFVGSHLARDARFTHRYRSTDIGTIAGETFERVVSAGAPAVKWLANKEPDADRAAIAKLTDALGRVTAREFVLISTVDVYPVPRGVDEDFVPAPDAGEAYGRHRRELEAFVRARFPDALIVRLPGLFGDGLKKNIIFDFLNANRLEAIHQDGAFQFYELAHLAGDIERALAAGVRVLNLATEPVATRDVARVVLGREFTNTLPPPAPRYDFHSRHAHLWGRSGPYLYSRDEVLADLGRFVVRARAAASGGGR